MSEKEGTKNLDTPTPKETDEKQREIDRDNFERLKLSKQSILSREKNYQKTVLPIEVNETVESARVAYGAEQGDKDIEGMKMKESDENDKVDLAGLKVDDEALEGLSGQEKEQAKKEFEGYVKSIQVDSDGKTVIDLGKIFSELSAIFSKLFKSRGSNFDNSGTEGNSEAKTNFSYSSDPKMVKFDKNLPLGGQILASNFIENNADLMKKVGLPISSVVLDKYRHSGTSPLCARTARETFTKNGISAPSGDARDLFQNNKNISGEMRGNELGNYLKGQVGSGYNFFDITFCGYKQNFDPKGTSGYHRVAAFYGDDGQIYVMDPYYSPNPQPKGWTKHNPAPFPLQYHKHVQNPNVRFTVGQSYTKNNNKG